MDTHSGIQGLPQEIFHMILDNLSYHKETLRSCSLVCRSWLQASRPHFFAVVSLYASERRLVDFLDFLDTHPDITNHVRSLMFYEPMDDQPPGVDGTVTPYTLVRTARRLPRLRELHLYFVHVVPYPPTGSETEGVHRAPPIDLRAFHIFGSAHQDIGPFLEMLAQLRTDRLELELVTFDARSARPSAALARRIHVRDLWMNLEAADDAHVAILSALASALSPGVLQAFHCSWREWNGCQPVGMFLKDVGDSLTDLTLNMAVKSWVEERGTAISRKEWDILHLSECTRVRTFRASTLPLSCPYYDLAETRRSVTSFRNLFAGLPASVHTVVLYMSAVSRQLPRGGRACVPAASTKISVDFHEIEEVLLGLPGIGKVVIALRPAQSAVHGAAAVAKAFPTLHARNILEVRSSSVLTGSSTSW